MRVSTALLAALLATLLGATVAHAQAADRPQPAADRGKAKVEGVSTLRSAPADSKKEGGCQHGTASDA